MNADDIRNAVTPQIARLIGQTHEAIARMTTVAEKTQIATEVAKELVSDLHDVRQAADQAAVSAARTKMLSDALAAQIEEIIRNPPRRGPAFGQVALTFLAGAVVGIALISLHR